jgi:hypothetical protein
MNNELQDIHVLNLGAGVQSTTLYLMFANGELNQELTCAIFADTGEEPRAVYEHVRWLQSLNGPPILIRGIGSRLGDDLMKGENTQGHRFAAIPAYTFTPGNDGEGRTRRQCSREYKIDVIERTIRRELCGLQPGQRIPVKKFAITQYVGISIDEGGRFQRIQRQRTLGKMRAPLIERHMTRRDCHDWLRERGNVPHQVPRSACVFCPFHDDAEWLAIKSVPEDWARAVEVDEAMRKPGNIVNRNMDSEMYLHKTCRPLVQIDFAPRKDKNEDQQVMGFWRNDGFSRDCLGVCGV